ncbi:hypothetical protein BDV09DRAFT_186022 [Aspergillus tetrazonus]
MLSAKRSGYIIPAPQTLEFIQFNHGPRICLGRMFGYFQMECTLCRIFQHFERVELHEPRVQRIKVELNTKMAYPVNFAPPACALYIDPTKILGFPTKGSLPSFHLLLSFLSAKPFPTPQIYQTKLPEADILLIQPVVGDMVWTLDYAQLQHLRPAVTALDAFLDTRSDQSHRLVVHAFSNAGSHTAVQLAEAYTAVHPLLGAALIYSVVATVALLDFLRLHQNVISKTRHALNSQSGCFLQHGVRRTYLYSQTDAMVPWTDILDHAGEARRLAESGDNLVQTVEFTGSGHVRHLAVSGEEYTKAVFSVAISRDLFLLAIS